MRPYAGFFDWSQRAVAEHGVALAFVAAAPTEPGFPLTDVVTRPRGEDPPDCEALDQSGRAIAIEVTELVDGPAIAEARRSNAVRWAEWTDSRIRDEIQSRISAKGSKKLKGGPYAELIVLIHTDEPMVTVDVLARALAGHEFDVPPSVARAYLLLSYTPGAGYPYFRLDGGARPGPA